MLKLSLAAVGMIFLAGCSQSANRAEVIYSGSTPESYKSSPSTPRFKTVNGINVIVARKGDTLNSLAKDSGTSAMTLKTYNGVPDNAIIADGAMLAVPPKVGQAAQNPIPKVQTASLDAPTWNVSRDNSDDFVPLRTAGPKSASTRMHVIAKGDTAYSISKAYGISIADLDQWNQMNGKFDLHIGQTLAVSPPSGINSAATTSANQIQQVNTQQYQTSLSMGNSSHAIDTGNGKFGWPLRGKVQADYGTGSNGVKNDGIDIHAAPGAPVYASEGGIVSFVKRGDADTGYLVLIQHPNNYTTVYTGLASVQVQEGMTVSRGQKVAVIAAPNPGQLSGLHFEIRQGSNALNPNKYLGS